MKTSTNLRIGLRMHGVRLNLACDHEPQLRYTAELLGDHVCEPWDVADVEVDATWMEALPGQDTRAPVFDVTGLDVFGKRMHLGDGELVWTDTLRAILHAGNAYGESAIGAREKVLGNPCRICAWRVQAGRLSETIAFQSVRSL